MEDNKMLENLKLQLFADGGEDENIDGAEGEKNKDDKDNKDNETKTFTQADFDREISKINLKFEEKFKKKQEEATKLANMNAEEKARYEFEQQQNQFNEERKEWTLTRNKYECSKILSDKGLPIAFADFCVAESADDMKKNIDLFDREFKKALAVELDKRTKGKSPAIGALQQEGMTKEKLATLPYDQQMAYLKENPDFL